MVFEFSYRQNKTYMIFNKRKNILQEHAKKLASKILIVDTHLDTPSALFDDSVNLSFEAPKYNFDFPRAISGGLKCPFWVVYISSDYNFDPEAKNQADKIISAIDQFINAHNDKFQRVYNSAEVLNSYKNGKVLIATGIENGAAIGDDKSNIKYFYDRGIRYITLTHAQNNKICDSSFDNKRTWNGLSPFGEEVIKEMNKAGMIIDVSHVSDDTFFQVMKLSSAPVVATHSSCRYYTPGFERNMSDEMIKLLADKEGVIQINFGSAFLRKNIMKKYRKDKIAIGKYLEKNKIKRDDPAAMVYIKNYYEKYPSLFADVKDVARHINHVKKLVGIDYVGIGSDIDGLGDTLPTGLKDVAGYPNLIFELLKFGYSDVDISKVMGSNFIRCWQKIEFSSI